jgi:hypothetical protein
MSDKIAVVEGGREAWLQHPYTRAQLVKAVRAQEVAMQRLRNACADSTDVNVVKAWAHLRHIEESIALLGGAENGRKSDEP